MHYIEKALKFLFSVYAGVFFLITLSIAIILYPLLFLFGGENASHSAHKIVTRPWAKTLLLFLFIRLKVTGKEKLSKNETYVFVSNHRSMLDIPVCALLTNHYYKFLAKEELTNIPVLGLIIKKLYITVSRASPRDRVKSMGKMQDEISKGNCVWIYPEGTRNKTEFALKDFEDGAFWLAVKMQKPIAAVSIVDTGKLLPSGSLTGLSPGRLYAYWEEPVSVAGLTRKDVPQLKEKVFKLMENRILELRRNM